MSSAAREKLLALLAKKVGEELSVDRFRIEWEGIFNFELERSSVLPEEFDMFQRVFDTVIWYSPFSHERKEVPNYKSEEDVYQVLNEVRAVLRRISAGRD